MAGDFSAPPACHANVAADVTYAEIANRPERWICSADDWSIDLPRSFLLVDLKGVDAAQPLQLTTRLTRFANMRLMLIGADGRSASREVTQEEMVPVTWGWMMSTPLPRIDGQAEKLVVAIDYPRHAGMLSDARVVPAGHGREASLRMELMLAMLCGILCVPPVLNLAFYRVLRERFLLWHVCVVVCMLVQTLATAGLINHFVHLSIDNLSILSAFSWGGGIAAAAMLLANLIEPGKLDRRHMLLIRAAPPWILGWTAFYLFADGSLRPLATPVYYLAWLPVLALFIWVLAVMKWRGSRVVNFQIAAWTPIMITGAVRIFAALGATDAPLDMLLEQHVSIGLEVLITWLGVTDRFMIIKWQRDQAQSAQKLLAERANRDPLTGLLNRGAIEDHFAELHGQGFHTMALVDLDHFKLVNDIHGHAVGDAVLRATAEALAPDKDTMTVRMGGEEFLLLLRGTDAVERAERRRLAIPARVAAEVPGLDRIVTASMGLVEHCGQGTLDTDFIRFYAHCDRVLYEAKAAGRNRTKRERIRAFSGAARPHRRKDQNEIQQQAPAQPPL